MSRKPVFRSILLAASALLMAACASQPASTSAATSSLLERRFLQAAQHYQRFQHEGQIVLCKKEPGTKNTKCITETQLRLQVENEVRMRDPVLRPVLASVESIG
jgi:outer membrane biogenesis lipoprotein LolB